MEGNKGVILLAESWFYYLALSLDSLSHIQLKNNLFGLELRKCEHAILAHQPWGAGRRRWPFRDWTEAEGPENCKTAPFWLVAETPSRPAEWGAACLSFPRGSFRSHPSPSMVSLSLPRKASILGLLRKRTWRCTMCRHKHIPAGMRTHACATCRPPWHLSKHWSHEGGSWLIDRCLVLTSFSLRAEQNELAFIDELHTRLCVRLLNPLSH